MKDSSRQWKRGVVILLNDLPLLASLCIAQFIVWRILRRRRKDNAERRKRFKVLCGGNASLAPGQGHAVQGVGWRPIAVVNSSGGFQPER